MKRVLSWAGAVASVTLLIAAPAPAMGAKLEKPECDALKSELVQLTTTGVKADMARGPEWAKANLAPERLVQVKRLIEIEEQLNFRCELLRPPPEAKAPGTPQPPSAKRRRARAAASDAPPSDDAGAPGVLIGGQLQTPGAAEPKPKGKPKAARRAKRKGDAAKAE